MRELTSFMFSNLLRARLSSAIATRVIFDHGHALIDQFAEVFCKPVDEEGDKFNAWSAECVLEGFDEDNDSEGQVEDSEVPPPPKLLPDIEAINETVRSNAASPHGERPAWLPSWLRLVWIIWRAMAPVFWEMFSGKG